MNTTELKTELDNMINVLSDKNYFLLKLLKECKNELFALGGDMETRKLIKKVIEVLKENNFIKE